MINTSDLVQAITIRSAKCSALLIEKHRSSFPESGNEFKQKQIEIFFECLCFFGHITSRAIFNKKGPDKSHKINNKIGPMLIDYTVHEFYQPAVKDPSYVIPDEFKKRFYDYQNDAEREYSLCTAFILKPEEDIAYADKVATGIKSKGTINLFTDNIVNILSENNPFTYYQIMLTLVSALDLEKLEDIALKASESI